MVGFKSIGLLFILLFLASCIPQTKQTECGTNEAFNALLRTCVPVMNGPSSFIDVDSFLPTSVLTKFKNDSTAIQFSIVVSNPYAQTYTVKWERVYNGSPVNLIGTSSGTTHTYTTTPSSLSTQLGIHVITAKVLDSNNSIVDSHSFELKINDIPKPYIISNTIYPIGYNQEYTPIQSPITFDFDIYNNSATIVGAGYVTTWRLLKSGVLIDSPVPTPFSSTSPTGTHTPSYSFDPSTLSVGYYLLNAQISNNTGEVVAEQQWSVTVAHPALKNITSRDIYETTTNPSFATTNIAYHGIPYTSATTYNFIPTGFSNQGDYCVSVIDEEGTYPSDLNYVRVNYYIDGASLIYSTTTSPGDNKVCLSDAPAAVLNFVTFNNTTSTATQTHTLVARVVDDATGLEYSSSNMPAGLGGYPITWNFQVRPANEAPTVTFTASTNLSNISCSTATTTSKTCSVTQDQAFTLGVHAVDDFYTTSSTTDATQAKFTYNMVLMRNGSPVSGQTCIKTISDVSDGNAVGSDFVGPDYLCSFTISSSDVNGSINPALNTYSISISFCDVDSPISGTSAACGSTLTYNLNVTEAQTAPVIVPQLSTLGSISADSYIEKTTVTGTVLDPGDALDFVTENEAVNFHIKVTDAEMDDFQARLYLCTDFTSTCATTSLISLQNINKTNNTSPTDTVISYSIPENLLPVTTPASTNVTTYFKVEVTDSPDDPGTDLTASTSTATSPLHFRLNVRNYNPAPAFAGPASPAVTSTLTAMVGYPLTIDPGTVSDSSAVATENTLSYQWYVDPDGGDNSYAAITGATSRVLRWTPSNGLTPGVTVNLALCISDGTVVNPLPPSAVPASTVNANMASAGLNPPTGPNCMGSWDVTVRPNAVALNYDNSTTDVANDVAIWQDTSAVAENKVIYSAYADTTGKIFVEKTVFDANGVIYNNSTSGFQTVSFDALQTGTVVTSSIKDISITGNATHLYIAYQAAESSTPSSPRIRIRRIDKQYGGAYGSKTDASYPHPGKFGFMYDSNPTLTALLPTSSNATSVNITQSPSLGAPILVSFLGDLANGDTVSSNGVAATASSAAGYVLCSGPCGTSTNAGLLETFINASSNRALQGITAKSSGSDTIFYGALSGSEYLDVANYVPGKLGKIMSIGGSWYLPFVDQSTAGSIGYVRMIHANSGVNDYLNTSLSLTTYTYSPIGAVNNFENGQDSTGNIVIAAVNTSNVVSLSKFDTAGTLLNITAAPVNIFGSAPVAASSLRVGFAVSSNQNYYIAAKVLTALPSTYEWKFGRYNSSFVVDIEDSMANLSYNSATSTVLDVDNLKDISIQAYASTTSSTEARLLVTSDIGTGNVNLYSVRFRSDNDLSCGYCSQINLSTETMDSSKRIATTPIFTGMTIGTAGSAATSTENNRNIFFGIYSVQLSAGYYKPQLGFFNAQVESIDSTSTDSTGLLGHRPPFFGSN